MRKKPLRDPKTLKHPRTRATLAYYAKRRAEYAAMRTLCLCIFAIAYAPAWMELRDAARLKQKRLMSARRSERYRQARKLRAKAERLSVRLAVVAAKIAAAEDKAKREELKRRKHASSKSGFMAGWTATGDLTAEEVEQYSKRFVRAFNDARTQRAKFEAQCPRSSIADLANAQQRTAPTPENILR
jgi:hypothetical protein